MNPRERFLHNPFFVLGLGKDASRVDAERTAQRLLAELAVGRESARHYETPLGPAIRSEDLVRSAMADLRDPWKRLVHEAWASVDVRTAPPPAFEPIPRAVARRLMSRPPRIVVASVVGFFIFVPAVVLFYGRKSDLLGALSALAGALLILAELPIAFVLVPLGLTRTTYAFARLATYPSLGLDGRVAPAFQAACALLRRPSEAGARFVEARLAACRELSAVGVAALAMVAFARGREERALALFRALESLPPVAIRRDISCLSREYLALEAAARGDWAKVSELGDRRPRSRMTWLLSGAARYVGKDPRAPSRAELWFRWALSPSRRDTKALLLRAAAPFADEAPAPVAPTLAAHAALGGRLPGTVRREDVEAATRSLDALRGSREWHAELARRALTLDPALDAERIGDDIVRAAEADLATVVVEEGRQAAWLSEGSTGDSARARVREVREARLNALAGELHRRARAKVDLPEADEWQAWGEVSRACDEMRRDAVTESDHEALFHAVHQPLWSYGYRLAFVRPHRRLARIVFRRSSELARAAKALDTYKTIDRNLAAAMRPFSPRIKDLEGEKLFDPVRLRRTQLWLIVCVLSWVAAITAMSIILRHPAVLVADMGLGYALLLVGVGTRAYEIVETDDGIVFQNSSARFVVPLEEVTLRPGPNGILWIRLARAPQWLVRPLWTVHSSRAAAEAVAARFPARGSAR